jgi:hypothetical protein
MDSLTYCGEFTLVAQTSNRISTYRISGSHSGGYEEYYLLGYNACSPLKVN